MTEKQYRLNKWGTRLLKNNRPLFDWTNEADDIVDLLNELNNENEQLKRKLERCKDLLNSDKNDYELTLSFIKNKGYSLKDVLEYEKELLE